MPLLYLYVNLTEYKTTRHNIMYKLFSYCLTMNAAEIITIVLALRRAHWSSTPGTTFVDVVQ